MLSFDLLMRDCNDVELPQLRILSELEAIQDAFNSNQLYPHLEQLVTFKKKLEKCQQKKSRITDSLQKRAEITGFNFRENKVERAKVVDKLYSVVENLNNLIDWTLPLLEEKEEEGMTIFSFIKDHLELKWVGIMPPYQEEGYLIIPSVHRNKKKLFILSYKLSVVTVSTKSYRSVKITDTKVENDLVIPGVIKRRLRKEEPEKPNPATLFADTGDIPQDTFPFEEALSPVCQYMLAKKLG